MNSTIHVQVKSGAHADQIGPTLSFRDSISSPLSAEKTGVSFGTRSVATAGSQCDQGRTLELSGHYMIVHDLVPLRQRKAPSAGELVPPWAYIAHSTGKGGGYCCSDERLEQRRSKIQTMSSSGQSVSLAQAALDRRCSSLYLSFRTRIAWKKTPVAGETVSELEDVKGSKLGTYGVHPEA